jgi:hypothetical protein
MNIIKVKIAEIRTKETNTKFGPRLQVSIREALEGGDRWLSGLVDPKKYKPEEWTPGTTKELDVFEREANGRNYWNFKLPSNAFRPNIDLSRIEAKLDEILQILKR